MDFKHHIILIDRDQEFASQVSHKLGEFIPLLDFRHFTTCQEASDYISQENSQNLDLVILENELPDITGLELLHQGSFEDHAVILTSTNADPNMLGASLLAGAAYYLPKSQCKEESFRALVLGCMDRARLQRELDQAKIDQALVEKLRVLLTTLQHEINNPLGVVTGATYMLRKNLPDSPENSKTLALLERSSDRIQRVITLVADAISLETVEKGGKEVLDLDQIDTPEES